MFMQRLIPALLLAACSSSQPVSETGRFDGMADAAVSTPSVRGRVVFEGKPHAPNRWALDEARSATADSSEYEGELWLVGATGGVSGCVVVLHCADGETPTPVPRELDYEKIGPRYVPRILVAPVSSTVTLRNVDSSCKGFMSHESRAIQFHMTVSKSEIQQCLEW